MAIITSATAAYVAIQANAAADRFAASVKSAEPSADVLRRLADVEAFIAAKRAAREVEAAGADAREPRPAAAKEVPARRVVVPSEAEAKQIAAVREKANAAREAALKREYELLSRNDKFWVDRAKTKVFNGDISQLNNNELVYVYRFPNQFDVDGNAVLDALEGFGRREAERHASALNITDPAQIRKIAVIYATLTSHDRSMATTCADVVAKGTLATQGDSIKAFVARHPQLFPTSR